ncbi:MAG: hypothetical protein WC815_24120 [Vicinamibacterales bacterium]|jgi:hypothetical protein
MRSWCYFLFRVSRGANYDVRLPIGGVVVTAADEVDAIRRAYVAADQQVACAAGEVVVCHPVTDRIRCHQARLMHEDWLRSHAYLTN